MLDQTRMYTHDLVMPILNGHEVRHRAAELYAADDDAATPDSKRGAQPHVLWLAERSGIPVGTIHNATRDHDPQALSLHRVYELATALRRTGEEVRDVFAAITSGNSEPTPDKDDELPQPREERPRDPVGPPPRPDRDRKGPPRSADLKAAS